MCGEVKKAALMVFVRMPEIYVNVSSMKYKCLKIW